MADVIPLRRIKLLNKAAIAPRFAVVAKAPPKSHEFRQARPRSPLSRGVYVGLARLATPVKALNRLRRGTKLRLFRVFKLLTQFKSGPVISAPKLVAERLRRSRALRRL